MIIASIKMVLMCQLQDIFPKCTNRSSSRLLESVQLAVNLLSDGHVIAVPTDTIYGLACDAQNDKSLQKLYDIKRRDKKKPVAICLYDVNEIQFWGKSELLPKGLLENLLPGPVTLILPRTSNLTLSLNPGVTNVGIRVPKYGFIQEVVKMFSRPIALTSANVSNNPSALEPEEFQSIWPHLGAVFDGGNLGNSSSDRAGSTIVDLSIEGKFSIVRKGSALSETVNILNKGGLVQM